MAKTSTHTTERFRGRLSRLVRIREDQTPSYDNTAIFFRSVGSGMPMVCCNGIGVSTFFWKKLETFFHAKHQVVTWDYRGHGQSGDPKDSSHATMDDMVADLKAVLDTCKIQKAILIGHSFGVQVILEFYRQYPDRVQALALCMGTYGHPMHTFYNFPLSRYIFDGICQFAFHFPRVGRLIGKTLVDNPLSFYLGGLLKMVNPAMAPKEEVKRYVNHITRLDTMFFSQLCQNMQAHSAEAVLATIDIPTLIIAGEEDTFTPLWISKKMNRLIKGSELFIIRCGSHAAIIEHPELINLRLEKFIQDRLLKKHPTVSTSSEEGLIVDPSPISKSRSKHSKAPNFSGSITNRKRSNVKRSHYHETPLQETLS